MEKKESNDYGIASLALGIGSIVFFWVPFLGLAAGVLAIIFYVQQKKVFESGINTAGLVTGIIGTVFSFFNTLLWVFLGAAILHSL